MLSNQIKTHLVKKQSDSPKVCTYCNNTISKGELYHLEQGISEHLHSLLARTYCSNCYAKYGENKLLRGKNK